MDLNTSELSAVASVGGSPAELLDERGRLVITPHPVLLDGQRNVPADLLPGESLSAFLARHVPSIESGAWSVSIGGRVVPAAMWRHTYPKHGQLISCRSSVHKSALSLIAMAALAYFTLGTGTTIGATLLGINGLAAVGAAGAFALNVGIYIVGSALINKVLGPKVPSTGGGASSRPIYSLSGQRNSPRPYEPIGVLLGEVRVTPDLASRSYTWFQGDEQYLSTILLGGINVASYADLSVGDTALSTYSDVAIYTNGFSGMSSEPVPLYSNADTIAGADLENNGAWITRTSSVDSIALQVDIEGQLFDVDTKGNYLVNAVPLFIETRPAGGTGAWTNHYSDTLRNSTIEVLRRSYSIEVAQGQYDVRVRLGAPTWDEGDGKDECRIVWSTLKSVQPDATDYSGWGRIGIKIRASGQLSGSLDTLRATFKPRPLPVWNGSAWVNATTRETGISNPGAQILQVLRGIYHDGVLQFGYGLADDQIDIEGLKGFMLHCTAKGYTYDRWITEAASLGSILDEIALAGMGQFQWLDGSRPTVSWAASGQPLGGVVTMANMLRGSFSVGYQLSNAADGIEYQYVDRARDFETVTLRVAAPGVTTMLNPARISGAGVTDEAHAAVMARYHLAQSLYQHKTIGFGADIEHLDYRRMSILSLTHDMTQWGYGGRLAGAELVSGQIVLTLDEPVPALPTRYIGLRVPGERAYRVFPVQAFAGESNVLTLTGDWPEDVAFPGDTSGNPAHDTLWCYDVKSTPGYRVRVVSIEPDSDLKSASVSVVPEGDEFWTYVYTGDYEPAPSQSLIPQLQRPTVSNLRVQEQVNVQGDTEYVELHVVWDSAGDYDYAQVWAALDGEQLRLVDGRAIGGRTAFRIRTNGEWLIEVRPFDTLGRPGPPGTVLYITAAVDAPPRNVDVFTLDEIEGGLRRFRFGYSGDRPASYSGVQIRYRAGSTPVSVADWDAMTPLASAGDVYTAAVETTKPPAGTWTIACRAISTSGVLSEGVAQLTRTMVEAFADIITPDDTPAPTPTGAAVTAGFASLVLRHDLPTYTVGHGHGKTRVYGKTWTGGALPGFDDAELLMEFTGEISSMPTALGTTWRIWMTWVTADGGESVTPAGGTSGIEAATGLIVGANLAPLSVTAAALAAAAVDLGSTKVTGTITDPARFGALAVGYTVTQYLLATSGVMENLVVDNAQIVSLAADKLLAGSLGVSRYLQSTNYVANTSGWRINADGTAEFGAASIRGQLVASQIDTRNLTVKDAAGNVQFGAGTNLDSSLVNPAANWLNSNVVVGGRNLLAGASTGLGWDGHHAGNEFRVTRSSTGEAGYIYSSYITLPGSTQVTLSFEAKQDGPVAGTPDWFLLPDNHEAIGLSSLPYTASTDWTKRTFTFITPTGWGAGASVRLRIDHNGSPDGAARTYFARRIKLELGNKDTDWTPPIEDVAAATAAAQTTANTAADNASSALSSLATMRSNGYLDASEKPALIKQWQAIDGERAGIVAQANSYGITTQRDSYNTAVDSHAAYLVSLSPGWSDTSSDTPIIPAVDQASWAAVYNTRQSLLNKIAEVAGTRAAWSGVSGSGKPADNATVGATWGANLFGTPSNLAALSGSESINNSLLAPAIAAAAQTANWSDVSAKPAFGTFALLDYITAANVSTYIAGAAIGIAHINTATITNLAALSTYTGTLTFDAEGFIRSGTTGFKSGSGVFIGAWGTGNYVAYIGGPSAFLAYSPSGGLEIKFDTFTVAVTGSSGTYDVTGTGSRTIGTGTATPTGGVAPYTYSWTVESSNETTLNPELYTASGSPSGNTCGAVATSSAGGSVASTQTVSILCTVIDANGRTAIGGRQMTVNWNGGADPL